MENSQEKRLKNHIKALENSYDNIIKVLNEELNVRKNKEGAEVIALPEDKIKIWAQGQVEMSNSANLLLKEIQEKEKELAELNTPKEEVKKASTKSRQSRMSQQITNGDK